MTIFPESFDQNVLIEHVSVADEITVTVRITSLTARCPCCRTASKHVQSRYTRTLLDLPSSGRPVHLIVHVRRFFCKKSTCAQKIFAERLPELCRPQAQRTLRLQKALSQLGLAKGGQTGARVGSELGLSGSRDTILRLVRQYPLPDPPPSRIVGLDEWAWKRRLRYGTLICDLERSLPIDLLPVKKDFAKSLLTAKLEREVRAKGYKGSQRGVYRYLATLEPSAFPNVSRASVSTNRQAASSMSSNPPLTISVQQATWLFFRKQADLKEAEQENLRLVRQASPKAEAAYQLVEKFLQMVREHTGEQLDAWLKEVEASHIEAFKSFVTGVQQDKDAVLAALTLPWSTGPLEGHVNRLKLIKRSMYGRAKIDLLRLRVLYHPEARMASKGEQASAAASRVK